MILESTGQMGSPALEICHPWPCEVLEPPDIMPNLCGLGLAKALKGMVKALCGLQAWEFYQLAIGSLGFPWLRCV